MTAIKHKVRHYLGVDENTPESVSASDWFKSNNGEGVKHNVSDASKGGVISDFRSSRMSSHCSPSFNGHLDTT